MYRVVVAAGQPACQNPPFPGLIPFLFHGLPSPSPADALCRHSDATDLPLSIQPFPRCMVDLTPLVFVSTFPLDVMPLSLSFVGETPSRTEVTAMARFFGTRAIEHQQVARMDWRAKLMQRKLLMGDRNDRGGRGDFLANRVSDGSTER